MQIRIIIVDDEPLARKRIAQLLAKEKDCEITAECANGLEAVAAIESQHPDLIFLDVQMPEISGFDVLKELPAGIVPPLIIFVTAFDQFTIQAFEVSAVDYLLKPFSEQRFRQALERAREALSRESSDQTKEQLGRLFTYLNSNKKFLERLVINHKDRLIILPVDSIDWIETYGNYLKIHSARNTYLLRETMNNLEERINPEKFVRIHRSTLVNADKIREFQPMFGGQYAVILHDGTELILSRSYRKAVLEKFEI